MQVRNNLNIVQYPDKIKSLWEKATTVLMCYDSDIESLITFGSVVNGDYYYILFGDKSIKILSDFEFSVVIKEDNFPKIKERIINDVDKFNQQYSPKHFGFNLNVKVCNKHQFIASLNNFNFFCNTIQKTGFVVYGDQDILSEVIDPSSRFDKQDLFYVLIQRLYNLLLITNMKFLNKDEFFPIYPYHILINTILKLGYVLSCFYGYYPSNYNDTLDFLKGKADESVLKQLVTYLNHKDISYNPSKDDFIKVKIFLVEYFNYILNIIINKNIRQENQVWLKSTELLSFVNQFFNNYGLDEQHNEYNNLRIKLILQFLKDKDENYNYYKKLYTLSV